MSSKTAPPSSTTKTKSSPATVKEPAPDKLNTKSAPTTPTAPSQPEQKGSFISRMFGGKKAKSKDATGLVISSVNAESVSCLKYGACNFEESFALSYNF